MHELLSGIVLDLEERSVRQGTPQIRQRETSIIIIGGFENGNRKWKTVVRLAPSVERYAGLFAEKRGNARTAAKHAELFELLERRRTRIGEILKTKDQPDYGR